MRVHRVVLVALSRRFFAETVLERVVLEVKRGLGNLKEAWEDLQWSKRIVITPD